MPEINIIKHYIKDLSFENPQSINENNSINNNNSNISQNMHFTQTNFDNNFFSVVVHFSCKCSSKKTEKNLFVLELDYFGLFKIMSNKSYSRSELTKKGAKLLLPFVKSLIEQVTSKGGSITITIEDFDFDLIKN